MAVLLVAVGLGTGCVVREASTECTVREGCTAGEICIDGQCVAVDTGTVSDARPYPDSRRPDATSSGQCRNGADCGLDMDCVDGFCLPADLALPPAEFDDPESPNGFWDQTEGIIGDLNWQNVSCDLGGTGAARWACAVAYLYIPTRSSRCTAWLAGRDLLATNNHCIGVQADAAGALAIFNYEEGTDAGDWDIFRCENLVATRAGLDLTLLGCEGAPGDTYGSLPIDLDLRVEDGDEVLILHQNCDWRGGQPCTPWKKQSGGRVRGAHIEPVMFGHDADTLGGSSGAPVLHDGKVVGIHRAFRDYVDPDTQDTNLATAASEFCRDPIAQHLCLTPLVHIVQPTFTSLEGPLTSGPIRIERAELGAPLLPRVLSGSRFRITDTSVVFGDPKLRPQPRRTP